MFPTPKFRTIRRLAVLAILLYGPQAAWCVEASHAAITGIDRSALDASVRPQDDLYRAASGAWLDTATIPDDAHGIRFKSTGENEITTEVLAMLEQAASSPAPSSTRLQRLGDLYASYLNEARLNELGKRPLEPVFERIDAIHNLDDVAATVGYLTSIGVDSVFSFQVNSGRVLATRERGATLEQHGTTIDDKYYTTDDAYSIELREKLPTYISRILELSGDADSRANAARVFEFERTIAVARLKARSARGDGAVAQHQGKAYTLAELHALAPTFRWQAFFTASGMKNRIATLYVVEPGTVAALGNVLANTPIDTVKSFLKYSYASARAPFLADPFEHAHFEFFEGEMDGVQVERTRSSRALEAIEDLLAEDLVRAYVERHISKEQMVYLRNMVGRVKQAYGTLIAESRAMTPATRERASAKLANMKFDFGALDESVDATDMAKVVIARDDLFFNVERIKRDSYNRMLATLDGTPEAPRALLIAGPMYSRNSNTVFLPIALLRQATTDSDADEAANFGGLGAVIGHEIGHAFDSDSIRFDAEGTRHEWPTDSERRHFDNAMQHVVTQFNAYSPLPGYHVDGRSTLAENIATITGLEAAYRAYKQSLGGTPSPVIDATTGEQRFFLAFAQGESTKERDDAMIESLSSDPHSPSEFHVNGNVRHVEGFYEAFGVQDTDKLYLPPAERFAL